jgi:hypothetical protein
MWITPRMKPHWGPFFSPSAAEIVETVNSAKTAKEAGLASAETATEQVAHAFGVDDINEELAEIEEDAAKADQRSSADAEAKLEALHEMAAGINGQNSTAARGNSREEPTRTAGRGGDGSDAADAAEE